MKTLAVAALIAITSASGAFASIDHDNLRSSVSNSINAQGFDVDKVDGLTLSQITKLKFLSESDDSSDRQQIKNILNN